MVRVVRFHVHGGPEVLRYDNLDVPMPGPKELRIDVRAIGLNRAESMFRRGFYLEKAELPARLGYEASGVVEAIGSEVNEFQIGDGVSVIPATSISHWGTYGEKAIIPAEFAVKHPKEVSWESAAALWMAAATAYGALVDIAGLGKGDFVAINAASSSVGLTAIQITNALGGIPIALTRTAAKRDSLLKAGAAQVVATGEEDLVARIEQITEKRGCRIVFDPVGGTHFDKLTKIAAQGGYLILYGRLEQTPTPLVAFDLISKTLTIRGFLYKEFVADREKRSALKRFVLDELERGRLNPVISRVFPFDQIVEATRFLESNEQFGKVVVAV